MEKIMYIFPEHIKERILFSVENIKKSEEIKEPIEEIRIGLNRPVAIKTANKEYFITNSEGDWLLAGRQDIDNIIAVASEHSMYMKEDEINNGYLTLKGGYRIGVCGTVSYIDGCIVHHGDITSINIRLQKEVLGCATRVIQQISNGKYVCDTLLVSPPKRGKTTVLRDAARILSDENRLRIGIIDERKEIWGAGEFNLGLRSDVLCGCNKADGIMMLVRTMSPDVIIVDELSGANDITAIKMAVSCGVSVMASIHGKDMSDVKSKGMDKIFERYVVLGERYGEFNIYKGDKKI